MNRISGFVRDFSFVVAAAAFWGGAEALITHVWGVRGVWRPLNLGESAFGRAIFYLFVAAAVYLLVRGFAFAIKRGRDSASAARWGAAAVVAVATAAEAGWLVLAVSARFSFKWGPLSFDVREPGGFGIYWAAFLAGAGAAAVALALLFRAAAGRLRRAATLARVAGSLLFAALVAYHVISPLARPAARGPDVVFIVLDAWRADAFNRELMPNLTTFAERRAVTFRNARATAPWTVPSMGSVFTGEYADVHERRHRQAPTRRPPTVAGLLRDAGYDTYALTANRLLQRFSYVVDGFDHFYYAGDWPPLRLVHFYDTNWYGPALRKTLNKEPPYEYSLRVAARLERLTSTPGRRPRFIWAHFMDPHSPYAPPPGYYDEADAKYVLDFNPAIKSRAAAYRRLYNGECRFMDDVLAPILPRLAANGRTVVIVAADHGEEFWEHRTYEHGKSVYETALRVPLLVAVPGEPPADFTPPVSLLGLGPTILDAAGVGKSVNMRGESLLKPPDETPALIYAGSRFTASPDYKPKRRDCVIWRDWKLIMPHEGNSRPSEFYDLRLDPGEKKPLPPRPGLATALRSALSLWQEALSRDYVAELDEDFAAELRALGYVQ
jgi:arylsulfatase A-like enzyme